MNKHFRFSMLHSLIPMLLLQAYLQASEATIFDTTRSDFEPFYAQPVDTTAQDKRISKELLDLLDLMEVSHDYSYSSIVQETQKKWLRPSGKERWDIIDRVPKNKREQLFVLAQKLGFINSVYPSKKEYDYCVVLGATVKRVERRFAYLANLWRQGIRFKKLVFLTGARFLDPYLESDFKILYAESYPETEADMMKLLYQTYPWPFNRDSIPLSVVDTVIQSDHPSEKPRRPNTGDTVIAWMEQFPEPGSCLVISDQYYILSQDVILKKLMKPSFQIETVGEAVVIDDQLNASVLLDTIARWLYAGLD